MKSNFYKKPTPALRNFGAMVLMLLGLVCFITACNKMDYTYKKFLKGGTIIYPGKADSILVFPGHNRIKLSWLLTSDPGIVLSRVYWNNKADSMSVPVDRSKGVDTVSVTIDSLAEGYYNFQIYTYDKDGHTSVEADTIGQVFGEVYAGSLHNRVIKKSYWDQDTTYVSWYKSPQGAIESELTYQDKNGSSHTLTVASEDTITRLPNFKLHDAFEYRTGYLPDSMAIDTFYAAYANITVNDTLMVLLPPYPSPDGTYAIINKLSGKVLTVDGASTSNNGNISQADFTGATNQLWKFVPSTEEAGYYAIENVNSGLGIAVAKASGDDGANILQYKYNSGSNDQWKPEQVSGAYYKLMVLKNDKVIEIANGSDNAQQNTWNNGDNQQFELAWNMALNQPIKDKSSDGSKGRIEKINDGDLTTFWQPNSGDRKDDSKIWAVIDLGAPRVFDEFDQYWTHGHDHINTYTIYYSNDGTTWRTAYQSPKGPDAGANQATFTPVKGRYVKYELHFETDGNVNVAEVGVYYFPK